MAETCSCSQIKKVVSFDEVLKYLLLSRLFILDAVLCCNVCTAVSKAHCTFIDISIYLSAAIGLTTGGSTHLHINNT
jgi:hypothetical protein